MAVPLPKAFARELPSVWRADELARPVGTVVATGSPALDAQLPGGGWPVGALVEIFSHCEWRLLLPALAHLGHSTSGALVLVGAPHAPFAPGLAGQGLNPERLLCINTAAPASRLWATEQALQCQDVTAVLAWLPQARAEALRRLQMAAAKHHKLLFVMRPLQAQTESSPAVLRVCASLSPDSDALLLHILKRRGPPLAQALTLAARPARLAARLAMKMAKAAPWAGQTLAPPKPQPDSKPNLLLQPPPSLQTTPAAQMPWGEVLSVSKGHSHALDRATA